MELPFVEKHTRKMKKQVANWRKMTIIDLLLLVTVARTPAPMAQ